MPRKAPKTTHKAPKAADLKIRLTAEDKARFEVVAKRRGLSLSAWLRMVALDAARQDPGS